MKEKCCAVVLLDLGFVIVRFKLKIISDNSLEHWNYNNFVIILVSSNQL